jgi:hypothetical protein
MGYHLSTGNPVPKPMFSFLSSNETGELQLGGYDPKAAAGPLVDFESMERHSYALPVSEITLDGFPILRLRDPLDQIRDQGDDLVKVMEQEMVPCILDSGTTCICLPDSTRGGSLEGSPWKNFQVRTSLYLSCRSFLSTRRGEGWENFQVRRDTG